MLRSIRSSRCSLSATANFTAEQSQNRIYLQDAKREQDAKLLNSTGSSVGGASVGSSQQKDHHHHQAPPGSVGGSPKVPLRGIIPVVSDARVPHSPADSVSEITAGREVDSLKIAAAAIQTSAAPPVAEIQPCD